MFQVLTLSTGMWDRLDVCFYVWQERYCWTIIN